MHGIGAEEYILYFGIFCAGVTKTLLVAAKKRSKNRQARPTTAAEESVTANIALLVLSR